MKDAAFAVDARHVREDMDRYGWRDSYARYAKLEPLRLAGKALCLPLAIVAFAVGGAAISLVAVKEWITDDHYKCRTIRSALGAAREEERHHE